MRELCHPDYSVEREEKNVRLRFAAPGSKFGPVYVVLSSEDASRLVVQIAAAAAIDLEFVAGSQETGDA